VNTRTNATTSRTPVQILVTVTYLVMIATNAAANALPLNGRSTGDVSLRYDNLFTPAGLTFSVWGVIYLLLGAHVLYQWGLFRDRPDTSADSALLNRVGVLFSVSSLANTAWIFAWHYDLIPLSALLLVGIMTCLGLIVSTVRRANLTGRQRWFIAVPFSVYFGWTTVAVVANITVLLRYWTWNGFGISEPTWAVIIVSVAAAIGAATMLRNRDVAYGLVLIWAFTGILIRQTADLGGRYPAIVAVAAASLLVFLAAEALIVRRRSADS
jgi:cell division protein FtsW (lipid II flippase)